MWTLGTTGQKQGSNSDDRQTTDRARGRSTPVSTLFQPIATVAPASRQMATRYGCSNPPTARILPTQEQVRREKGVDGLMLRQSSISLSTYWHFAKAYHWQNLRPGRLLTPIPARPIEQAGWPPKRRQTIRYIPHPLFTLILSPVVWILACRAFAEVFG